MSRAWMPLYIADYLADTAHLDCTESGAYLHLIMHYWQRGSLPRDDKKLSSIARASLAQWQIIKPVVAEFFDPKWKHKRIDLELDKSQKAYEKRALAGKLGGKSKASNAKAMLKKDSSNAKAMLWQSQSHREESLPLDLDPTSTIKDSSSPKNCPSQTWTLLFDAFWEAWPNKVGRPAARKVFERLAKRPDFDYPTILKGVSRYKRDKPPDRPWLNPSTFLNQERWNDEPAKVESPSVGRSNGTRGAMKAFLNGDTDVNGCEKSSSNVVPLLPSEWRRD